MFKEFCRVTGVNHGDALRKWEVAGKKLASAVVGAASASMKAAVKPLGEVGLEGISSIIASTG